MADRDQLISHITETQRALRDLSMSDRGRHPLLDMNLTMSQLKVMVVLHRDGGMQAQDLAARIGASPATLSGIVDRLAAQDLVTRKEDTQDRRVRILDLTEAGRAQVDRLTEAGQQAQQRLFRRLDDRQLGVVAEAFDLILDAARDD